MDAESDEAALTASSASPDWYVGAFAGTCLDKDARTLVLEKSDAALLMHTTIETGLASGDTRLDYAIDADGTFASATATADGSIERHGQCDEKACTFDSVSTRANVTEHFADTYRRTPGGIDFASSIAVTTADGKVTSSSVQCALTRR
jgi:hypothetical protein